MRWAKHDRRRRCPRRDWRSVQAASSACCESPQRWQAPWTWEQCQPPRINPRLHRGSDLRENDVATGRRKARPAAIKQRSAVRTAVGWWRGAGADQGSALCHHRQGPGSPAGATHAAAHACPSLIAAPPRPPPATAVHNTTHSSSPPSPRLHGPGDTLSFDCVTCRSPSCISATQSTHHLSTRPSYPSWHRPESADPSLQPSVSPGDHSKYTRSP